MRFFVTKNHSRIYVVGHCVRLLPLCREVPEPALSPVSGLNCRPVVLTIVFHCAGPRRRFIKRF